MTVLELSPGAFTIGSERQRTVIEHGSGQVAVGAVVVEGGMTVVHTSEIDLGDGPAGAEPRWPLGEAAA